MTRTIKQAASECRAAWALHPDAEYGWCVHHEVEMEELTEPIENRIQYILDHKAKTEQIVRLDNLRPVLTRSAISALKTYDEAESSALKTYDEAESSALKTYDEAESSARKAYDKSLASARKAYDKSLASARKAYNEARASARKAYDEAVASARKAYNEARASALKAHKQDVPNHTWNGRSIFAKE